MTPPNVVVLLLDAARADHVSSYGYDRVTTPFIDSLAAEGVAYDPTYANSVFSLPSYASLFTGEYPSEHGAIDWNRKVSNNALVEGLNDRGYETAAVSSHLVTGEFGLAQAFDSLDKVALTPDDRLFDEDPVGRRMSEHGNAEGWSSEREKYLFFLRTLLFHPSPKSIANGGYALYWKLRRRLGYWTDDGGAAVAARCADVITRAEEPFFLFANFVETHDPYRPPRTVRSRFLPDDASFSEVREAVQYSSVRASLGLETIDSRQREILSALYDAELAYVDSLVESVYGELETAGVADSTVVVVLSDHGDYFGEHGLWGHQGGVYDPVSRVPLVVRYPWEMDAGADGPYELRSLVDHILRLADGERTPMPSNGEALTEYYGIDTQLSFVPQDKYDSVDPGQWGKYQCHYTDGEYQLVWDAMGRTELYVQDDFGAETDIAATYPDIVSDFQDRVRELVGAPDENHESYRSEAQNAEFELAADVADRLRQLGYTG